MSVAWVGAGIAAVSAVSQASAAGDAADAQEAATQSANGLTKYQYDNNVALQAPTINAGNAARDRLAYGLGLSPTGYSGSTSVGGVGTGNTGAQTYDTLRNQLLSQYTSNAPADGGGQWVTTGTGDAQTQQFVPGAAGQSTVDEAGLRAEIDRQLAAQSAAQQAQVTAAQADPAYGSLAKEYTPDKFSYTGQDLFSDPSYQFRLDQGQQALDRQGAASGRFLSGAQLQASSDYNQGAASQEFGNAYNRALGTFNTNEGNRFGAYQANFNNTVNPLLSLAGAATLGSQNLGNAGANAASTMGANLTNQANATGAAGIATAGAISGGLTNAYNGYQQNQLLTGLLGNKSSTGVNNNPLTNGRGYLGMGD